MIYKEFKMATEMATTPKTNGNKGFFAHFLAFDRGKTMD